MEELAQNQGEATEESLAASLIEELPNQEEPQEADVEAPQEEQPEDVEAEQPDDGGDEVEADSEDPLYTVKINGVEQEVTIEDLIAGYQKSGNYDERIGQVNQDRETLKAEKAKLEQMSQKLEARLG